MKIELNRIRIRDLVEGFTDAGEDGVVGYGGKLNIRPAYQREFVYAEKQQVAVIKSVVAGLPLNVMYWSVRSDGTFELLDGQQRTLSICNYVSNVYSVDFKRFFNLTEEEKKKILDYELMIYICDGTDKEKLSWFETINISGEKLTKQELLNAVYAGPWLASAKSKFSRTGCVAHKLGAGFVKGSPIRQDILETTLGWISGGNIEEYMAAHQHDENADGLWDYFRRVINWARATFPVARKEQASINWGKLYGEYGNKFFDADALEKRIQQLLQDEDVTKLSGIYPYLLTGEEKHLNIRAFSPKIKVQAFTRQQGVCAHCQKVFKFEEMEADHITPWSQGGGTVVSNCQMLCLKCNRTKSDK